MAEIVLEQQMLPNAGQVIEPDPAAPEHVSIVSDLVAIDDPETRRQRAEGYPPRLWPG